MAVALINGNTYHHAEIIVNILDVPVPSVSSISYATEQAKENTYGTGTEPVGRGKGTKKYSGSIEMSLNDARQIRAVTPTKNMCDVPPFDISVIMAQLGGTTNIDRLTSVEFASEGVESNVDDMDIKYTYDIIIGQIQYG